MGRYYAMDRDNRWDRVEKAYRALDVRARASRLCPAPAGIQTSYDEEKTDEFVLPYGRHEGRTAPTATVQDR